jgi:hypothetical protein
MPDIDDFDFRRDRDEESRFSAADHRPGEVAARVAEFRPVTIQFTTPGQAESFAAWLRQHDAEVAAKALEDAVAEMRRMMDGFAQGGRHTRAAWALTWIEIIVDRIRREAS